MGFVPSKREYSSVQGTTPPPFRYFSGCTPAGDFSNITSKLCPESASAKPIQKVRDSISKLEIRCPIQRDCCWKGILCQTEQHLDKCA